MRRGGGGGGGRQLRDLATLSRDSRRDLSRRYLVLLDVPSPRVHILGLSQRGLQQRGQRVGCFFRPNQSYSQCKQ